MSKTIYLLVGGEATRLKPLSEGIPKALLTVKDTSIIDLIIDNLEQAGFEKFKLICSIKHKEQWEQYQNQTTRSIELLFETEKLDTAGYIVQNIEAFEETFFCMNGDLLLDMDFQTFISYIENDFNFKTEHPFNAIYIWLEQNVCEECIEYIVSIMMEPYSNITEPLVSNMSSDEDKYFNIPTNRTVQELLNIIETRYSNILEINFDQKENNQNFWFISKNKEEPRLADRFEEHGSELEQPLAIARDIKKLYEKLLSEKNNLTISEFLSLNSDLRHVVRRAFIIEKFPYSEIQDNTIGKSIVPIDMLRLKLSFFGALKFDPRSDKWLRICMFQGAPLPNELKNYDEQWVYKTSN